MKFRAILIASIAPLLMAACETSNTTDDTPLDSLKEVIYTPLSYDEEVTILPKICNPERGFYSQSQFLTESGVKANRVQGRSLHLLLFYLTDFISSDISADYLAQMQTTFDNLRKGGSKAIIRFGYKDDMSAEAAPWDATPHWVARHIEQVTPLLNKNADVIFVVQAGFFGPWGEWHTSSNFTTGTAEGCKTCKEVIIDGLLNALPKDRQVEVRTPSYKMRMYDIKLADTLTVAQAHNGSDLARIGGHNDCFLAKTNDYGTFMNAQGKGDWLFWDVETRYTIMGGETCDPAAERHHCPNALKRLAEQHWCYLNINYHRGVLDDWRNEGCFNEAYARLGYRLVLQNGYFTPDSKAKAGRGYRVVLNILNDGFAAPMNPRGVEIVLVDSEGNEHTYKIDSDPRFWFESTITTLDTTITLPKGLPDGECRLYLNLPDGYDSLADDPRYSIRLINKGIWNSEKGYNFLTSFNIK
ncbi:MAG: DUF4832 domain-containing protein [Tidjanibacter sp.]|nr:DUF4832 domain-containing protein [Tidjanibacter sp.]